MSDAFDFIMAGGAKAFPFENLGDSVSGEIVDAVKRQQTDLNTKQPAFWDSGEPKMMTVITLQTELRDSDDDDGLRTVYLRGGNHQVAEGKGASSLVAVREAVKKAGQQKPELGGTLTLAWSGNAPKKGGMSAAKLYSAAYKPPVTSIDLDEMG